MVAFWMRSLRARPVSALCIFALTALTVAAAAAGPLVSRAIGQSALAQAVATAPDRSTDITANAQFSPQQPLPHVIPEIQAVAAVATSDRLYHPPTQLIASYPVQYERGRGREFGRLVATSDACARTPLLTGRCPTSPTEVAFVPAAGVPIPAINSQLSLGGGDPGLDMTVVGVVDRARAELTLPVDAPALAAGDLIVTADGISRAGASGQAVARSQLAATRLRLDQLGQIRASLSAAQDRALTQDVSVTVESGLTGVLDQAARDRTAAEVLLLLITVQALAAAWFGAFAVYGVLSQERQREWALGRLRGLGLARWLSLVFAEPLALLLLGTAAGYGLAIAVGRFAIARYLRPDTPLEPFRAPVLLAALAAALGSVAALVVASRRGMRAPLASLLREGGEPNRVTRAAAISETLVLVLAAAAVVELVSSPDLIQSSARLGLVSPALLSAALTLASVRILVILGRRVTRRPGRSLAGVLLVRRLIRTPTQLRGNVVVAITAAVLFFATQLAALSSRNQELLARATTGAATVLTVNVPADRDLVPAVRAADPSGRIAMAVQQHSGSIDNGTSRILAVDSTRLAAVAAWRPVGTGLSTAAVAARLHPPEPAAIRLTGTTVQVELSQISLSAQGGGGRQVPIPHLVLTVADQQRWHSVDLGQLQSGQSKLRAPLGCPQGCRLVRAYLDNSADTDHTSYVASFVITAISTDRQPSSALAPRLRHGGNWRVSPTQKADATTQYARPSALEDGLHINAADLGGSNQPSFEPTDVPDPLPAFVASNTDVLLLPGQQGALAGTGLGGDPQLLAVQSPQLILPRLLGDGVLVDLSYAQALSDPATNTAIDEVWLAPGQHPTVLAGLKRQHITVLKQESLGSERQSLALAATARAGLGGRLVALIAALVAAGIVLATQLLATRRRRELWDVLRLSRINRRRRLILAAAESALPALAGLALGSIAALLSLLLAGTRMPLLAGGVVHQPLQVAPAWLTLAATAATAGLVTLALAMLAAVIEERRWARSWR